jgi:phosphate transport system substrate-binding protein
MRLWHSDSILALTLTLVFAAGCDSGASNPAATPPAGGVGASQRSDLEGRVVLDGSSTVAPIASAAVGEFKKKYPEIEIAVGKHGTTGGFQKFVAGEIDIANASLPIEFNEIEKCRSNKVQFIELAIGFDGLTIVVNRKNDWLDTLTLEQVKTIFSETNPPKKWKDVDPKWPDTDIKALTPGASSGTLKYFKEVVVGKDGGLRSDVDTSEEDNVLVKGVADNENAIGFFGVAYYLENQDKLKAVKNVNPETKEAHLPSNETIGSGAYAPFSRPLFMYVNAKSANKAEVRIFLDYILGEGKKHVSDVGYVQLPEELYERTQMRLDLKKTGTSFHNAKGEKQIGGLDKLYTIENLAE